MKIKKIFSIKDIKKLEIEEFKKRGNSCSMMVEAGINSAKKITKLINRQHQVIVICGPGNNAGDGFIIGNYLITKNYKVDLFCLKTIIDYFYIFR